MDNVNPAHYRQHPSGVECIKIARHFNFCLGNAFKYIWRAGIKTDDPRDDLRKAIRYLEEEINRWESANQSSEHAAKETANEPLKRAQNLVEREFGGPLSRI